MGMDFKDYNNTQKYIESNTNVKFGRMYDFVSIQSRISLKIRFYDCCILKWRV